MSLVYKAAAPMHYFGTHYDAGDVIVTTGWADEDVVRLLRHEPVYVSESGTSLPDQTGNAGKVLGTDGTDPAWVDSGGSSPVFNFASAVPANAATDLTTFDFADVQWDPVWTRINGADITIRPDGITFDVVTTGLYHVSFYNSVDAVADVSKPLSFAIFGGIYPGADGGGTWNDPGSQFQDNGAGSVIWQNEWKSLPITLTDPLSHDRECMLNFPNEPLRLLAGTSFRFRTGVQPFDESSFTGVAAVSINYSAAVSITRLA